MKLEIKVKGVKKALQSLKALEKDLEEPFREVIKGGGQLIRGEAIKSIQTGPKSGRTYEKYNPRRTHKASAPGQPPASDTGFLVNNIKRKIDADKMGGEIASRAFYSKFLEFGTSKMLPRPFMFPALEKNRQKILKRINQAIKVAGQKSQTKGSK